MASEASNVNGNTPSLAAMLAAQHSEQDTAHKATVEDVPDEDELKHPPPSSSVEDRKPNAPSAAPTPAQAAPAAAPKPKEKPAFDVQSEELFPALGGPKPKTPAAATWGAKPSAAAAVANGAASGSKTREFFQSTLDVHKCILEDFTN